MLYEINDRFQMIMMHDFEGVSIFITKQNTDVFVCVVKICPVSYSVFFFFVRVRKNSLGWVEW